MNGERRKLEEYIKTFQRRKILMISIFAATLISTGIGTFFVSPIYRAHSLIAIAESENVIYSSDFQAYMPPASLGSLSAETFVFILEGFPLAKKVSENLLSNHDLKISAEKTKKSMEATYEKPEIIRITGKTKDPKKSILIANTAAQIFIEENKKRIRAEMVSAIDFITKELAKAEKEMNDTQNALEKFKASEGITDIDTEVTNKLNILATLQESEKITETELKESEARLEKIIQEMGEDKKTILNPIEDPLIVGLRDKLTGLQVELAAAKTEFSELHPKVKNLRSRIEMIEKEINTRIREISETENVVPDQEYYSELRTKWINTLIEVVAIKSKLNGLSQVINELKSNLSKFPKKQKQLQSLSLVAGISRDKYKDLLQRLQEANIEVEKLQGNATIIDLATEAKPILTKLIMYILCVLLSFGLAIAAGFTAEYLDNTIKTAEETTRYLEVPLLGAIPKIKKVEDRIIRINQTESSLFEVFRRVRSGIKFASVESPIRTLLITSALRKEGKSLTVINLGIALSQKEPGVILVDADLRKPELHKLLNVDVTTGLTNVLAGDINLETALQATYIEGMSLLPAGFVPPNPGELLESQRMKDLINDLSSKGRIVLFDSPPVLSVADPLVLAVELDAVLPVIEAGNTTREGSLQMKNQLVNTGTRLIGFILNKARVEQTTYY